MSVSDGPENTAGTVLAPPTAHPGLIPSIYTATHPPVCPLSLWPGHLIVVDNALSERLIQHLLVPLLQALGLGDLLIGRVAVEDVVVALTRGTGPDVPSHIPAGQAQNWGEGGPPASWGNLP